MTRPHRYLAVMLLMAIALSSGLLVATASAHACPLRELRQGGNLGNSNGFKQGSDLPDQAGEAMGNSRQNFSGSADFRQAGRVGFAAIAGTAAIAVFYGVRRFRRQSSNPDGTLANYPELEHPELVLTSVPQEAFSSPIWEKDFLVTRSF
ncbi:hypothetical protein K9N68_04135 [Kovacikia minuta CCNUW1]|uniref:hypothetical protein n=1 Tax=Kovacikia minuta TaxID=2931930 RepID=UPI001CC90B2D|nr:hypothetical protein [Kovacikia minuta]UBF27163.1 hypothetical protein K9N68_04135 [Kovacikia minuta CCNUW1]